MKLPKTIEEVHKFLHLEGKEFYEHDANHDIDEDSCYLLCLGELLECFEAYNTKIGE